MGVRQRSLEYVGAKVKYDRLGKRAISLNKKSNPCCTHQTGWSRRTENTSLQAVWSEERILMGTNSDPQE